MSRMEKRGNKLGAGIDGNSRKSLVGTLRSLRIQSFLHKLSPVSSFGCSLRPKCEALYSSNIFIFSHKSKIFPFLVFLTSSFPNILMHARIFVTNLLRSNAYMISRWTKSEVCANSFDPLHHFHYFKETPFCLLLGWCDWIVKRFQLIDSVVSTHNNCYSFDSQIFVMSIALAETMLLWVCFISNFIPPCGSLQINVFCG